jgi:hypothetical protein
MPTRVSLNELQLAGLRFKPAEAAAIVVEICRQQLDGRLPGVPSVNVIRVTDDGNVVAEGPINADGPEVVAAAQLLDDLLPDFKAPPSRVRSARSTCRRSRRSRNSARRSSGLPKPISPRLRGSCTPPGCARSNRAGCRHRRPRRRQSRRSSRIRLRG